MNTIKNEGAAPYESKNSKNLEVSHLRAVKKALQCLEQHFENNNLYPTVQPFITPDVVKDYLILTLAVEEREHFHVLFLDNQHKLLNNVRIFSGTIDGASVYPREVAKKALELNAAAVIFAHNHPSGVLDPSSQDIQITQKLKEALALFDIRTLDHIVVGKNNAVSFTDRGLL